MSLARGVIQCQTATVCAAQINLIKHDKTCVCYLSQNDVIVTKIKYKDFYVCKLNCGNVEY